MNSSSGTGSAGDAAIQRLAEELAATGTPAWQPGRSAYPPITKAPLLVAPTSARRARGTTQGSLGLGLAAGAAAAFVGGLVWAGVVIATRHDIGFLAWFVGSATGLVVVRVAGGPVRGATKAVTGLLAVGGIMVGKYVIFVHDVRKTIGAVLAQQGLSVGYLDSRQLSIFFHHFGSIVRPIYGLWALLAFTAAVRASGGKRRVPR